MYDESLRLYQEKKRKKKKKEEQLTRKMEERS
jgi:hypothetical protein